MSELTYFSVTDSVFNPSLTCFFAGYRTAEPENDIPAQKNAGDERFPVPK